MKTFNELIPEIEAGKVVISLWSDPQAAWYRDDRGKYVLKLKGGFCIGDTIHELLEEVLTPPKGEDEEDLFFKVRSLLALPAWHVIDTSLPEAFSTGVTLFSLRQELEAGQEVSPLVTAAEVPYCFCKDSTFGGFIRYTPGPMNDILSSYASVDELFTLFLGAHFPIWTVGKSPAFRAVEEEFEQVQRKAEAEEAALDVAPPRTIEVSEREYRKIMAQRETLALQLTEEAKLLASDTEPIF